jgi:hypothetical protein
MENVRDGLRGTPEAVPMCGNEDIPNIQLGREDNVNGWRCSLKVVEFLFTVPAALII